MQQFQWQDRFGIGVEIIDQAHHRLFTIVQKIMELYVERHESRYACIEGIKYFKAYTLKHFAEEEAYMRTIGYPGYLAHKRIHDRMRRETLPALERELYAADFSDEAVQHFIGVCTGWLTGHIMLEDRAITGEVPGELALCHPDDSLEVIRAVILHPLQEMFGPDVQYIGLFTRDSAIVDAQCYELIYSTEQGQKLRFILIIGEKLLLSAAGLMLGIDFYAVNDIVRFAIREIAQSLVQRACVCFGGHSGDCRLEEDRFLKAEEHRQIFQTHVCQHSLLFSVGQDCFALCMERLPRDGCAAS